jgi:hypothetical protein
MTRLKPRDIARRQEMRINLGARLGWRIDEWVALTNTSRPTVWRQVKSGSLRIVYVDKIPFVPRTEAIRLGFLRE